MMHLKQFLQENDTPAPKKASKSTLPTAFKGGKETAQTQGKKSSSNKPSFGGRSEKPFRPAKPEAKKDTWSRPGSVEEYEGKMKPRHRMEDEEEGGDKNEQIMATLEKLTGMVKELLGLETEEADARHEAEDEGKNSDDESPNYMKHEEEEVSGKRKPAWLTGAEKKAEKREGR